MVPPQILNSPAATARGGPHAEMYCISSSLLRACIQYKQETWKKLKSERDLENKLWQNLSKSLFSNSN